MTLPLETPARRSHAFLPSLLLIGLALLSGPHVSASPATLSQIDAETLIKRVVKSQRASEKRMTSYTYDQREVETKYDKNGQVKDTVTRLFYVFSGDNGGEGVRELVSVDGRLATPDEKREAAAKDEKGRQRRLDRRAAAQASSPPTVKGDEDDPIVGTRRLSDLLGKYEYHISGEEEIEGRLYYQLDFAPKKGVKLATVSDRALGALAGRALVDAADFQIRSVEARLLSPVKAVGGLAANVQEAAITYQAAPVAEGKWFPCRVDLRLKGKAMLFLRLDSAYRFEFANFRSFAVDTATSVNAGSPRARP